MARDPAGGLSVWKVLSIPADPVAGILDGLERSSAAGAIGNVRLGAALAACSFD